MASPIKQLRQDKADLSRELKALAATAEGRDFTKDENAQYNTLKAKLELSERLIIAEEQRMDAEREEAGRDYDRRRGVVGGNSWSVWDRSESDPSGGFHGHVDFFRAVMAAGQGHSPDSRLIRFKAAAGSDEQGGYSSPYGGFLVPKSVLPGVLSIGGEDDVLANLTTRVPMETPTVAINARTDKNHSTSVSGGLTVTRKPETVAANSSRMQFEQVELKAHGLFGLTYASEEILQDSAASFLALLQSGYTDEFAANAMDERLNGTGTGEFRGVLGHAATIDVAKETGQEASTILTENIDRMAARCWRYSRAIWLANPTTRPQLRALVRVIGTGGSAVPYFSNNPDGQELLDGRPIFFTEFAKALGTSGDLILGNWSQYLEGEYQPMEQAESIHVRFVENERAFRFWKRNDGTSWWRVPLTPKNGDTLSPWVTLQTRA